MNRIRTIVIDDETPSRSFIVKLVAQLNTNFDVVGEADSVRAAYHLIHKVKPDLILLDIKMQDGNGFSLLNMFDTLTFDVVFISGFDTYAIQAFEFHALDYILKPIDPERFAGRLHTIHTNFEKKEVLYDTVKAITQTYDQNSMRIAKIPIHSGNKVILLSIEDILCVHSQNGYTIFKTCSSGTHISSKQLSDFEFILENQSRMIRANKGVYINLDHVASYSKGIHCLITMKDGTEIEISRRKRGQVLELLVGKKKSG